jgi:hypothetical protein
VRDYPRRDADVGGDRRGAEGSRDRRQGARPCRGRPGRAGGRAPRPRRGRRKLEWAAGLHERPVAVGDAPGEGRWFPVRRQLGSGETAASIVISLLKKSHKRSTIDVLTSRGILYSRGESYDENRFYSDPGDWPLLSERTGGNFSSGPTAASSRCRPRRPSTSHAPFARSQDGRPRSKPESVRSSSRSSTATSASASPTTWSLSRSASTLAGSRRCSTERDGGGWTTRSPEPSSNSASTSTYRSPASVHRCICRRSPGSRRGRASRT